MNIEIVKTAHDACAEALGRYQSLAPVPVVSGALDALYKLKAEIDRVEFGSVGGNMIDVQPEALRLAEILEDDYNQGQMHIPTAKKAAAELRRLHQSEREGWRHADELEQERKRLTAINAQLLEALEACLAMLERADCSTGYCCCGSSIDGHGMGDGHSPADEGDYYQSKAIELARAAIAAAKESA